MNPGDDGIINFRVRSNGREWEVNNIIIERKGASSYVAYIYDKEEVKEDRKEEEGRKEVGLKEVKEGLNTIVCMLPSLDSLYYWVDLIYHCSPRFAISDEVIPDDCC